MSIEHANNMYARTHTHTKRGHRQQQREQIYYNEYIIRWTVSYTWIKKYVNNNLVAKQRVEYPFAFVVLIKMKIISNIYFIRTKEIASKRSEQLMQIEQKRKHIHTHKNCRLTLLLRCYIQWDNNNNNDMKNIGKSLLKWKEI